MKTVTASGEHFVSATILKTLTVCLTYLSGTSKCLSYREDTESLSRKCMWSGGNTGKVWQDVERSWMLCPLTYQDLELQRWSLWLTWSALEIHESVFWPPRMEQMEMMVKSHIFPLLSSELSREPQYWLEENFSGLKGKIRGLSVSVYAMFKVTELLRMCTGYQVLNQINWGGANWGLSALY